MTQVRYDKSHHSGGTPEARVANRLKNSGGENADHVIQKGNGPNRTFTNVHSHGQGAGTGRGPRVGDKQ